MKVSQAAVVGTRPRSHRLGVVGIARRPQGHQGSVDNATARTPDTGGGLGACRRQTVDGTGGVSPFGGGGEISHNSKRL